MCDVKYVSDNACSHHQEADSARLAGDANLQIDCWALECSLVWMLVLNVLEVLLELLCTMLQRLLSQLLLLP